MHIICKKKILILISVFIMYNLMSCSNSTYYSDNMIGLITSEKNKTYLEVIDLDKNSSLYKKKIGKTDEYFYSEILYDNNKNIVITCNSNNDEKCLYNITNNETTEIGKINDRVSNFKLKNEKLYGINNSNDLVIYDLKTLDKTNEFDLDGYIVDIIVSNKNSIYILSILNEKTYLYTIKNNKIEKNIIFNDSRLGSLNIINENLYIATTEKIKGDINNTNDLLRIPSPEIYIKKEEQSNIKLYTKLKDKPLKMFIEKDYIYILTKSNNINLEKYELNTGNLLNTTNTKQNSIYGVVNIKNKNYIFGDKSILKLSGNNLENIYELNNDNKITIKIN